MTTNSPIAITTEKESDSSANMRKDSNSSSSSNNYDMDDVSNDDNNFEDDLAEEEREEVLNSLMGMRQVPVMKTTGSLLNKHPDSDTLSGRWTKEEHSLFLEGLRKHGREWRR